VQDGDLAEADEWLRIVGDQAEIEVAQQLPCRMAIDGRVRESRFQIAGALLRTSGSISPATVEVSREVDGVAESLEPVLAVPERTCVENRRCRRNDRDRATGRKRTGTNESAGSSMSWFADEESSQTPLPPLPGL
jgi:hypothetical protein